MTDRAVNQELTTERGEARVEAAAKALAFGVGLGEWSSWGDDWKQAWREKASAVLAAADAAQGGEAVPYCYVYEYDSPLGLHRALYPKQWNGKPPNRTVAVYTHPAPAPAVPEGYAPVPVEPTEEMLDAAQERVDDLYRLDAANAWTAMLSAAPKPEAVAGWVPVSERLPDDPQDCVFYSPDLRNPVPMLMGLYIRGKFKCAGFEMVNVTHWMPLPAAPQEPTHD